MTEMELEEVCLKTTIFNKWLFIIYLWYCLPTNLNKSSE